MGFTFLPAWCWKEEGAGPSGSLPSPPRTWCSVPALKAQGQGDVAKWSIRGHSRRAWLGPGQARRRRPGHTVVAAGAWELPPPGATLGHHSVPDPRRPAVCKVASPHPPPLARAEMQKELRKAAHLFGSWAGPGRQLLPSYPTCWRRPVPPDAAPSSAAPPPPPQPQPRAPRARPPPLRRELRDAAPRRAGHPGGARRGARPGPGRGGRGAGRGGGRRPRAQAPL